MGQVLGSMARRKSAIASAAAEDSSLWMIVGLGNPGQRYNGTRHNIGFAFIDSLAGAERISMDRQQDKAAVGRGHIAGAPVMLVKPQTFMNRSGHSVGTLARYYKVPLDRVLVVADDLDTALGALRLRAKGSDGGHNGLRSVQAALGGANTFPRLRLGIGRPDNSRDVADFVLQLFTRREAEEVDVALAHACDAVRAAVSLGLQKAISGVRVDATGKTYTTQAPPKAGGGKRKKSGGDAADPVSPPAAKQAAMASA